MALRLGADAVAKMMLGADPVSRLYLGADLVWSSGPTIVAFDDFARSAGTLQAPWSKRVSYSFDNFAIDSSQQAYRTGSGATDSSDGNDAYVHQTALGSQRQYGRTLVRVFASGSESPPGIVLRTATSGQGVFGQVWRTGWRIFIATPGAGGGRTTLNSGSGTYTAGDNIELVVVDQTVTLSYAGAVLGSATSASMPTGGFGGFCAGQNANRVDDVALGVAA